jgi:hypothetical protein
MMVGRALSAVNRRFGRRAAIWGALLAAAALTLGFVPLFDLLGYDFSFAIGLGAAFAAVDIGQGTVAAARRAEAARQRPTPDVLPLVGWALVGALATLIAPLVLSLANMVRVQNCNVLAGLGFFALLPVATVLFAAPAGVIVGLAFPRRGRLVAWLLPVASLVWSLLRLYLDPPVFAFDPFGGYFPGPIYDEALRPPLLLFVYRLVNLVWIGAAVALAAAAAERGWSPRAWRRWPALVALPLVVAGAALFAARGHIGYHVRRADLERALDGERRTAHFVLRFATNQGLSPAELALAEEDLEFRYDQLRRILGVEPRLPITVYEFPTPEQKKGLVGAGNTLYAKPWTRQIFIQSDRFPSDRLRHEMAHVFAGAFGDPLFGVSLAWRWKGPLPLPRLASGLIEGIAEAADAGDPEGPSTIHQQAAAMLTAGRMPPLAAVVGAGFSTMSGARAYTAAGSFTRYLLEAHGADKLRRLYRTAGDFDGVYGVPLAKLEQDWRQLLSRQPVSPRDRAQASERFRRPAIFLKVCARELAARAAEARLVLRSAPDRAVRLLEETCRDDPHEPTFRLQLAEALAAAGETPRAMDVTNQLLRDGDLTDPMRARVSSLAGTIYFHTGDFANAAAAERRVAALAPDEGDRRSATAKLRALSAPAARDTLGRALYGDQIGVGNDAVLTFFLIDEFARVFPGDRLGPYLIGRQLLSRDPAHALPFLRRACGDVETPASGTPAAGDATVSAAVTPLPPDFGRECHRMVADAAYRVGDFARARLALRRLAATAETEADRLRALDMLERVDWAADHRHTL